MLSTLLILITAPIPSVTVLRAAILHAAPPAQAPVSSEELAGAQALEQTPAEASATRSAVDRVRAGELAAASGEVAVSFEELDQLLVSRYALAPDGKRAAVFLAKTLVLDELLAENGLEIGREALIERYTEIDAEVRAGGGKGLEEELRKSGVALDTFLETLRLGMAQEILARRALGLPEGEPVSGDNQELWLSQVLDERGVERLTPPYVNDVVARVGKHEILAQDLGHSLRIQLPAEELREGLEQLLLQKSLFAKLAPIDDQAIEEQLDLEIERRRIEATSDPAYSGVPFEDLLAASGRTIEGLRSDPALRVRALLELQLEREASGENLRARYRAEQARFDDLFGESVSARWIFREAQGANQVSEQRTALERIAGQANSINSFAALALEHSQHAESAEFGGNLGDIHRAGSPLDPRLVDALFEATRDGAADRCLGPMEVRGGVVLLWAGARQPAPPLAELLPLVREELARRLLRGALPGPVVTFVDPQLATPR